MRKYPFHYLFVAFAWLMLGSCHTSHKPHSNSRLFAVQNKDEFYGYINEIGDTVIPCELGVLYTDTIVHIGFIANKGQLVCIDNHANILFRVFCYDNGPDYVSEGLFRMVDDNGLIGYADTLGNIVIPPKYKCAFPFENGKAKVADDGYVKYVDDFHEYSVWISDHWYYIDHKGVTTTPPDTVILR